MKVSFTLIVPIEIKRLRNGERAIWQTAPDEHEFEIAESEPDDESYLRAREIHKIFDEFERQKRRKRKSGKDNTNGLSPDVQGVGRQIQTNE